VIAALTAGLSSSLALADEPAVAAADAPAVAAEKPISEAVTTAAGDTKYSPPPGYKTKTRKGQTVYCRSRAPLGTRIKAEECFTQAEIQEVERAMQVSTEDTRQRGRMCTTGTMCTGEGGG
jgi:hypothetical protein